jgi:dTDP-4-dehydrorhamnose 3,5-epimerase
MQITRFPVDGVLLLTPIKHVDARGFFSEVHRNDALAAEGITADFVQENHVFSANRGVLRGMHFQTPPHVQGKLVRCIRGAILDVAVDIRTGSPTFGRYVATELSASNFGQLWVPPGFAHGYLTLDADCEVIYKVTDYWAPNCERGLAWDDSSVAINWPIPEHELTLADKDRRNPSLDEIAPVFQYQS